MFYRVLRPSFDYIRTDVVNCYFRTAYTWLLTTVIVGSRGTLKKRACLNGKKPVLDFNGETTNVHFWRKTDQKNHESNTFSTFIRLTKLIRVESKSRPYHELWWDQQITSAYPLHSGNYGQTAWNTDELLWDCTGLIYINLLIFAVGQPMITSVVLRTRVFTGLRAGPFSKKSVL